MRRSITLFLFFIVTCQLDASPRLGFCTLMLDTREAQTVSQFRQSIRRHFCPGLQKDFHVFTHLPISSKAPDIHFTSFAEIYLKGIGYHALEWMVFLRSILENKETLETYDYLYVAHPSLMFMAPLGDEILQDRVALEHLIYRDVKPFEQNEESSAYQTEGTYYSSSFFGGTPKEIFTLCETILANIQHDVSKDYYVAPAGLESYLNRYFFDNPPTATIEADDFMLEHDYQRTLRREEPSNPKVLL